MPNHLRWDGDAVQARIRAATARRIAAACILVTNRAKQLLSVAGTGAGPGGKRHYGSNPSLPGEPPHKQFGHLRRSVTRELDAARLVGRVGTNLKYGRWLELGTAKIAARPWLRRALAECRAAIRAIFAAPLN